MIAFPNAKINLGLNILERRSDGFHNIESLLIPIKLSDILEVIRSTDDQVSINYTGIKIPHSPKPDLCLQAYAKIKERFSLPGLSIHLHKNIPAGAGLGGGSSDAAFTLKILNQLLELGQTHDQMRQVASELGSDCPFFIKNRPCFVSGRGEIMEPFPVNLSGLYLGLVKPPVHITTAEAYAGVNPSLPKISLREVLSKPLERWKDLLVNDFEESAFRKFPLLAPIKQTLYRSGALYAGMSGSGSALYGLFKNSPFQTLREEFPGAFIWAEQLD